MRKTTLFAGVLALLFILSCNNQKSSSSNDLSTTKAGDAVVYANIELEQPVEDQKNPTQQPVTPKSVTNNWDKKIIKNATVNIETKDFSLFSKRVKELVQKYAGYTAEEQQDENAHRIQNVITLKVPVDQFEPAMNDLATLEGKLNDRKITSEDVTTEVVDVRSRIEAKKQVRQRYLDLLKLAKNMEEVLNVQKEINAIQEEIELAAGRFEYLTHASAMSTIHLTYFQVLDPNASDPTNRTFSYSLGEAFKKGWMFMKELFVGIITIWPLLLGVFAVWVFYKRSRNKVQVGN